MKKFIYFLISITVAMQIFTVFASADALYDEPNDTLFFRQWYYDATKAYAYAMLDSQYANEQKTLSKEMRILENTLKDFNSNAKSADKFIALINKYQNFDNLTITMLNEFVEKILVHERARKGSVDTTQEIEIYFNFIGKFVPPSLANYEPTPEEIEEQKKIEARKERLHQNYLRRKERGMVQKEYERNKAKKKAAMDEKKNAIRAEDIANGVFIPVGSLPKQEPTVATAV